MSSNLVPRADYPWPQRIRKDAKGSFNDYWETLNGHWSYELDNDQKVGLPEGEGFGKQQVVVPFPLESKLSETGLDPYEVYKKVWYKTTFRIRPQWRDRRILLRFSAVDYETHVYLNGKRAGLRHRGGYTPFCYDVTNYLVRGENTVVVLVYDDLTTGPSAGR